MWWWLACAPEPVPRPDPPPVAVPADGVARIEPKQLRDLLAKSARPTVINFWATWCAPCLEEMPALDLVRRRHSDVDFLFVSLDDESAASRIVPLLQRHDLADLPVLLAVGPDPTSVARAVVPNWPDAVPVTVLTAPGGQVLKTWVGAVDPDNVVSALASPLR